MLQQFADDIWLVDGATVSALGFDYPTRAAVIRVAENRLLLWSPVALTDSLAKAVRKLGTLRYVVAPNTLHHLFVADWLSGFPESTLYGPKALAAKRKDLSFDGFLDFGEVMPWGDSLIHQIVRHKITTEAVFFHPASRTTLFTDLIQQFPDGFHKGWRRAVANLDLMVGETPNVPRKFRIGFGGKAQARTTMKPILEWPAERVVMAHGAPVTSDGQAILHKSFDWFF